MKAENMIARIREHVVDIQYTTKGCFNAYDRIIDANKKAAKNRRVLNNVSIAMGMLLLSGLITYFISDKSTVVLIITTFLSLAALMINIYLSQLRPLNDGKEFKERAEAFNSFQKKVRTTLARIDDGHIAHSQVWDYLNEIEDRLKILHIVPLHLEKEDYNKAYEDIEGGQFEYTENELKGTKP